MRISTAEFGRNRCARGGGQGPNRGGGPFRRGPRFGPDTFFIRKQTREEFDPERAIRLSQVRSGHSRPGPDTQVRTVSARSGLSGPDTFLREQDRIGPEAGLDPMFRHKGKLGNDLWLQQC